MVNTMTVGEKCPVRGWNRRVNGRQPGGERPEPAPPTGASRAAKSPGQTLFWAIGYEHPEYLAIPRSVRQGHSQ